MRKFAKISAVLAAMVLALAFVGCKDDDDDDDDQSVVTTWAISEDGYKAVLTFYDNGTISLFKNTFLLTVTSSIYNFRSCIDIYLFKFLYLFFYLCFIHIYGRSFSSCIFFISTAKTQPVKTTHNHKSIITNQNFRMVICIYEFKIIFI